MEKENKKTKSNGAGMRLTLKQRLTPRRIALIAVFVALAFSISILSFSVFPASPVWFLKLDFGNVLILLISFLLGPLEGLIVCALKEGLCCFTSLTGGVGELANMLMTSAYILLPSILYQYRKTLKTVIAGLAGACVIGTVAALLVNRFIFPLFGELLLHTDGIALFYANIWLIIAFNLIKTTAISVVTLLLYKRLSNFLKKVKI